jgi:hypothetical protein
VSDRAQRSDAPAPPIEAIDEPDPTPNEYGWGTLLFDQSYEDELLCPGVEPDQCNPTRDEIVRVRRQLEKEFEDMQPADGEQARAVAKLAIDPKTAVMLVAWRARNGRLCTEMEAGFRDEADFPASWGPFGACLARSTCREICVEEGTVGVGYKRELVLLGGTVATSGEELRIVLGDGKSLRFATTGPTVPGFSNQRAFMADIGQREFRKLELLVDGWVVASQRPRPVSY